MSSSLTNPYEPNRTERTLMAYEVRKVSGQTLSYSRILCDTCIYINSYRTEQNRTEQNRTEQQMSSLVFDINATCPKIMESKRWTWRKLQCLVVIIAVTERHDTIFILRVSGHTTEHFGCTSCLLVYFGNLCSKLCGPGSDCSQQNSPTWTHTISRSQLFAYWENFHVFYRLLIFFSKSTFSNNPFRNTIWVSNRLD